MRGRIRQLKPDVFFDEDLWALIESHPDQHILQCFEGLWVNADREGRFQWRPAMLKSQILPYWGGDFERALELLRSEGFIVQYVVDGKVYGWIPAFLDHQRPNNREPESVFPPPPLQSAEVSLEHAEAGDSGVRKPRAEAPRASQPPLPTPDPNPYSQPRPAHASTGATALHRERGAGGVARTTSLPSEEPTQEYLDAAVMAGVSPEQARSTWEHYWGAGLPDRGVEKLIPWMVKRAKEHANQTARATRAGPSRASDVFAYAMSRISEEEAKEQA